MCKVKKYSLLLYLKKYLQNTCFCLKWCSFNCSTQLTHEVTCILYNCSCNFTPYTSRYLWVLKYRSITIYQHSSKFWLIVYSEIDLQKTERSFWSRFWNNLHYMLDSNQYFRKYNIECNSHIPSITLFGFAEYSLKQNIHRWKSGH